MPTIGLIGYGAIGRSVHALLERSGACKVDAILVRNAVEGAGTAKVVHTLDDFLGMRHDVVVECAGQSALRQYASAVVASGSHLVPASVGALVDDAFRIALCDVADRHHSHIRIPCGAMPGIDGLASARWVGLDRVVYRGTMPPHALKNFDAATPIQGAACVFSGSAREAVQRFPKNANLTGTIALAGIGFDATRVEIHVDPAAAANIHELEAEGDFGKFQVKVAGNRIAASSPSSRIVPGSLVLAALGSGYTLLTSSSGTPT
ncbi:aspartate dehydrogenase [Hydrogenophaga sp. 2FB]|uniref:aspartate dehydrogenase n=1 Tax=Hydrogenophaga sp. 2FB TaxID=2502187 RepID=UPI0010F9407C|nr:aspartate dehydrogenase [Hydrogenophaga sp. 2FB]